MDSLDTKHPSVDTLLASMSKDIGYIVKSIDNIERKLETKVDLVHFEKLEKSFEEHKKETVEKINDHAMKLGVGAALLTAGSWLISVIK
jgi:hypothetical protein